ncbi:MAG: hypothetical protein A2919_00805 [Candidatus Spechtbacteria bacterium RIFCSPLOWO2_01_FULL_43_12]|uniref:DUF58 domain-containing protein n=1 Tax=Candidatus Spechtbacteria bacterium RIFCSPLOWO2_01_FULL_43_12 TaxID=1802162 RepID=A0A1G2HEY2_9BACT|nr:MAG: hypothetical protein A2919_00805 [Candidatus Spechtbacteria bacterium RIFCSPLOWO2_01_FULL_43_12]
MDRTEVNKLFDAVRFSHLALKPRSAKSHLFGDWDSIYAGEGFDFEEMSEYVPGDNPRRINIDASMRAGKTIVVKRKEQREDRVLVVLDISPSMFLRDKMAAAYSAAAMVFISALRQRIPCGMFIADTSQTAEFLPRLGKKQLYRVKEALETSICDGIASVSGLKRNRSGNLALRAWRKALPKGSCVFVISDFLGNSDENLVSLLEERLYGYKVVPVVIQDELEYSFPTDIPRGGVSVGVLGVETQDVVSISISRSQAQRIKQEHEKRFSELKDTFFRSRLLWAHISSPDLEEMTGILRRALHRISKR